MDKGESRETVWGQENDVRTAKVVTVDNSLRKTRLKLPIQKPYPLEINVRDEYAP